MRRSHETDSQNTRNPSPLLFEKSEDAMEYLFWVIVVGFFGVACFGCGYAKRCDDERAKKLRES